MIHRRPGTPGGVGYHKDYTMCELCDLTMRVCVCHEVCGTCLEEKQWHIRCKGDFRCPGKDSMFKLYSPGYKYSDGSRKKQEIEPLDPDVDYR